MSEIFPFYGTRFDTAVVGDIKEVVAPPYDVIDASHQEALHRRHPHNVIRLELGLDRPDDGPTNNRYTRAAATLQEWLANGVLKRDRQPALYYHTIDYHPPSSDSVSPTSKVLRGFLALVKLEDFDSGQIYPHENTRAAAKTDRLNLLEACRANVSPIWSLYSDPEGTVVGWLETAAKGQPPLYDFEDDAGFHERLWPITDPEVVAHVTRAMRSKPLFIADGHHRYETTLHYRSRRRNGGGPPGLQPYDCALMLLTPLEDPGLTVLPTHRVLTAPLPPYEAIKTRLGDLFDYQEFPFTPASQQTARSQFLTTLRSKGRSAPSFGMAVKGDSRYTVLTLKPTHRPSADTSPRARLDVSLLQQLIVAKLCPSREEQEAMLYTKDDHEALDWVAQGVGTGALLLNATKVEEIRAVALAGERMPHKSTYFFPKPLTGLVLHVMEE
ncbi:MAG: DUF1015 domain-containing protein [Nitrospira sp.]|nr:DUF1015 domain-containing protein [Nitrospira sp.]MCP9463541.1 DUF1015 domain-containing protein [Nitrospira sp.]